ncbi:hypothetical protein [Allokutzneria oryzae]|uniref:Uncharacterized protein n=1 Tax=Allokutzneria oryzae TaxID=1378989 RepID=A0ABV5ZXT0_9PSEU
MTNNSGSTSGESKWAKLPERVLPSEWCNDKDTEPLPESLAKAEAEREGREARNLIERVGW